MVIEVGLVMVLNLLYVFVVWVVFEKRLNMEFFYYCINEMIVVWINEVIVWFCLFFGELVFVFLNVFVVKIVVRVFGFFMICWVLVFVLLKDILIWCFWVR